MEEMNEQDYNQYLFRLLMFEQISKRERIRSSIYHGLDPLVQASSEQIKKLCEDLKKHQQQNQTLRNYTFPLLKFQKADKLNTRCSKIFAEDQKFFKCQTCQFNQYAVLCTDCFQSSNHEGHTFRIGFSNNGGCCDCGDQDIWDIKGTCPKHNKKMNFQQINSQIDPSLQNKFNQQLGFYFAYWIYIRHHGISLGSQQKINQQALQINFKLEQQIGNALIEYLTQFNTNSLLSNALTYNLFLCEINFKNKKIEVNEKCQNFSILQFLLSVTSEISRQISNLFMQLLAIQDFRKDLTIRFIANYSKNIQFATSNFKQLSCQLLPHPRIIKELIKSQKLTPLVFKPQIHQISSFQQFNKGYNLYLESLRYFLDIQNDTSAIYFEFHIRKGCLPSLGHYRKLTVYFQQIYGYNYDECLIKNITYIIKTLKKSQNYIQIIQKGIKDLFSYLTQLYQSFDFNPQQTQLDNIDDFYFMPQQLMFSMFIFAYYQNTVQNKEVMSNMKHKQRRLIEIIDLKDNKAHIKTLNKMIEMLNRSFVITGLNLRHPQAAQKLLNYQQNIIDQKSSILSLQFYLYKVLVEIIMFFNLQANQNEELQLNSQNQLSFDLQNGQISLIKGKSQNKFILETPLLQVQKILKNKQTPQNKDDISFLSKAFIKLSFYIDLLIQASETDLHQTIIGNMLGQSQENEKNIRNLMFSMLKNIKKIPVTQFQSIFNQRFYVNSELIQKLIPGCNFIAVKDGSLYFKAIQQSNLVQNNQFQCQFNHYYFQAFKHKLKNIDSIKDSFKVPSSRNHFLTKIIPEDFIMRVSDAVTQYFDKIKNLQKDQKVSQYFKVLNQLILEIAKIKRAFAEKQNKNVLKSIHKCLENIQNFNEIHSYFNDQIRKILSTQLENSQEKTIQQQIKSQKQIKIQERNKKLNEKKQKKIEKFKNIHQKITQNFASQMNKTEIEQNQTQLKSQNFKKPQKENTCIVCHEIDEQNKGSDLILLCHAQLSDLYNQFFTGKYPQSDNSHLIFKSCGHCIHKKCLDKVNQGKNFLYCRLCKFTANCWFPVDFDKLLKQTDLQGEHIKSFIKLLYQSYSVLFGTDDRLRQSCTNGFKKNLFKEISITRKLFGSIQREIIFSFLLLGRGQQEFNINKRLYISSKILKGLRILSKQALFKLSAQQRKQTIEKDLSYLYSVIIQQKNQMQNQKDHQKFMDKIVVYCMETLIRIWIFNYAFDQNFDFSDVKNKLSNNCVNALKKIFDSLIQCSESKQNQTSLCIKDLQKIDLKQGLISGLSSLSKLSGRIKFIKPPETLQKLLQMRTKCQNCHQYSNFIMVCLICGWKGCKNCKKSNVLRHTNNNHCGSSIYLQSNAGNIFYVSQNRYFIYDTIYEDSFGNQFKGFKEDQKIQKKFSLNEKNFKRIQKHLLNYDIFQTIRYSQMTQNKVFKQMI